MADILDVKQKSLESTLLFQCKYSINFNLDTCVPADARFAKRAKVLVAKISEKAMGCQADTNSHLNGARPALVTFSGVH